MAQQEDKPIPGPQPVGPEYIFEPDLERPKGPGLAIGRFCADLVRVPVHWIRENIIEPNRGPKYYWYHRKYGKALPVDECYADDFACIYEADIDYQRNLLVDKATLDILRYRRDSCYYYYSTTQNMFFTSEKCDHLKDTYEREEINFFIKYGDLHHNHSVLHAYNKQKNRMIVERRKALRAQSELPEEKPDSK